MREYHRPEYLLPIYRHLHNFIIFQIIFFTKSTNLHTRNNNYYFHPISLIFVNSTNKRQQHFHACFLCTCYQDPFVIIYLLTHKTLNTRPTLASRVQLFSGQRIPSALTSVNILPRPTRAVSTSRPAFDSHFNWDT